MWRTLQDTCARVALMAPIAVLLSTGSATAGPPSNAACWMKLPSSGALARWPDSTQQIDVYVDNSAGSGVGVNHYNPIYVAKATEVAVERWNEQIGIPQRLVFKDFTTTPSSLPENTIVIKSFTANACPGPDAQGGCVDSDGKHGYCTRGFVQLSLNLQSDCPSSYYIADYYQSHPGAFADLLTHELGHALGREHPWESSCPEGLSSVMRQSYFTNDPSSFDRNEMQAVYGARAASNVLKRRALPSVTSPWGAEKSEGTGNFDIAPAPGASFGYSAIGVPIVRFFGATTIVLSLFHGGQYWLFDTFFYPQYGAKKAVSSSYAPNGDAVVAYIGETASTPPERQLCIRRFTAGSWSAESCSSPCAMTRNSVSTTYDPVSGRFLVAHTCGSPGNDYVSSRVLALAPTTCNRFQTCGELSKTFDIAAAETPVVACGPTAAQANGAYSNCRLVYAQRNSWGQKIAWRYLGFVPAIVTTDYQDKLNLGPENQTAIETEHAPAVAWYVNAFSMALSIHGKVISSYYLLPTATQWVFDGTLFDGSTTPASWVSPPFLSSTYHCVYKRYLGEVCSDTLHAFWLQYR